MFVHVAIDYYFAKMFSHFTIDHYDLSNSIVAKSLSHHYTMNIVGPVTIHETLVDQHSQWPHIPCQSQIETTSGETREYICTHCKNYLWKKIHLCQTKLVQMA